MAGELTRKTGEDEAATLERLRAELGRLSGELARAQARIAELEAHADVDPLVELLNRRGFERELNRSLAYIRRYGGDTALFFIDLDGFKAVNDAHGHAVGDALLRAVAATLAGRVRASDVVGRLGGDEFGVLMWNIEEPQALAKAGELEAEIAAAKFLHGSTPLSVGASVGLLMLWPEASAEAAIDAADGKR